MITQNEEIENYRLMESLATDGMWVWYINDGYEYFSPRWKEILGYEDHELENKPETWQNLIFQEDKERGLKAYEDHVTRGKPYHLLVRYKHKDGKTIWIVCRGQAVKNSEGEYYKMIGTHQDVTELVENDIKNKELQKFQETIDRLISSRGYVNGS